ncbi:MAG: hypothetical protein ABEK02_01935, partial [Haloquadratum sp.]
ETETETETESEDEDGGPSAESTSTRTREIPLDGSEAEADLPMTTWEFAVVEDGKPCTTETHHLTTGETRKTVPLSVPPYTVPVRVTGGVTGETVPDAEIELRTGSDETERKETDLSGETAFEVPRSTSTVGVEASHEQLPATSAVATDADRAAREGVEIELAPETGAIEVETTVGSRSWSGVEVEVTPTSEKAKAYTEAGSVTTDESGTRQIDALPTGEYELAAHPEVSAVTIEGETATATVMADQTTRVSLSFAVSFRLSADQRDRRTDLRERIDGLTDVSNHDTAIPHYYGTVLAAVLDLIDELESSPERAVEAGTPPGAAADALLGAVDEGIDVVDGAMSERRNVKLFRACESMAPADASWDDEVDLDSFFEWIAEGIDSQRETLRDRLEDAGALIDEQWSEVVDIGPVQGVYTRVDETEADPGSAGDELEEMARLFVRHCLVDAVESFFEHDALYERLNTRGY